MLSGEQADLRSSHEWIVLTGQHQGMVDAELMGGVKAAQLCFDYSPATPL
jgi:hypothetical protein